MWRLRKKEIGSRQVKITTNTAVRMSRRSPIRPARYGLALADGKAKTRNGSLMISDVQ